VFSALKRSLSYDVWIRRGLGVAVILGVVAIALGWDTNLLTKFFVREYREAETHLIEALRQILLRFFRAGSGPQPKLADEGPMPELNGAISWVNSSALSTKSLRGKVVLIDFWTYSCINCLRALPYVEGWAAKYRMPGWSSSGAYSRICVEKNAATWRKLSAI